TCNRYQRDQARHSKTDPCRVQDGIGDQLRAVIWFGKGAAAGERRRRAFQYYFHLSTWAVFALCRPFRAAVDVLSEISCPSRLRSIASIAASSSFRPERSPRNLFSDLTLR